MNRKIGRIAALINMAAVMSFAFALLLGSTFVSYFSSTFIAFSFVPMMGAFCLYAGKRKKLSGYTAMGFAIMYAAIICLVYYAQMTAVRTGGLSEQAAAILDFQQFGLFFHFDLLGYALMSLATFFAGLTVAGTSRTDKALKTLLLIHGVFFITCFITPLAGLFTPDTDGAAWIGTLILLFWCAYFLPVGLLSFLYFSKHGV